MDSIIEVVKYEGLLLPETEVDNIVITGVFGIWSIWNMEYFEYEKDHDIFLNGVTISSEVYVNFPA